MIEARISGSGVEGGCVRIVHQSSGSMHQEFPGMHGGLSTSRSFPLTSNHLHIMPHHGIQEIHLDFYPASPPTTMERQSPGRYRER